MQRKSNFTIWKGNCVIKVFSLLSCQIVKKVTSPRWSEEGGKRQIGLAVFPAPADWAGDGRDLPRFFTNQRRAPPLATARRWRNVSQGEGEKINTKRTRVGVEIYIF